jgi:hypothetical protein
MRTVIQKMKLLSRHTPTDVRICSARSHSVVILIVVVAQEKRKATGGASEAFAGLHIGDSGGTKPPKPPARPAPPSDDEDSVEEEDENDPFGDRNALQTPHTERGAPKW